jgi:hypothetical protein
MDNIFKDKAKEEGASIIDLKVLVVLVTRLLIVSSLINI